MGAASTKNVFSEIVQTLLSKDIDSTEHEFWDELWKTVLSVEDMFEVIAADDVRSLIHQHPENMRTLFTQAVAQLYQVVETPYPIYFDQALNCARILSRVMPFLLETESKFVKDLMWGRRFLKSNPTERDEDENKNSTGADGADSQESEPLAVILVNTIFHLLFLPDFTIDDPNVEFSANDVNSTEFKSALMWAPGVGCAEKTVVSSTQYDKNRVDILRLMVAAFSDSLYQQADSYDSCKSMWLEVATSADAPYAEIVFYSLMNTVLGYDPVGWGLPYGNMIATDTAKLVMESAVQVLVVLLDYGHPIRRGDNEAVRAAAGLPSVGYGDTDALGFNVFRRFLGSIESPDQLNFIYKGFVRLLNNSHQAESSYLPYSITRIGIEQELLVLLWKCLEEIPRFMPFILKHCDVTEILVPICFFMLEGRKDPSKVGLMYLCTFTLLKLSGERNFGVSLNKPYQLRLPVDVPLFNGNHSDLLVIVLHKLIVSGSEKLAALYNCFLTIICNVSPYCKSLGTVAAVKLVNLFQLFVSPGFLYASETNYVYVAMILEMFNNIVQYQYEGNGNLIYALIRRRELFEGLANLTLDSARQFLDEVAGLSKPMAETAKKLPSPEVAKKSSQKQKKSGDNYDEEEDDDEDGDDAESDEDEEEEDDDAENDDESGSSADLKGNLNVTLFPQSSPTELVSTAAVQRTGDQEGEAKTTSALQRSSSGGGGIAHGRFEPTEQWLQTVKAELPLHTILRLLKHLVPQVEDLSRSSPNGVDEQQVIDFLHSTTMVGLLPVPHPIVIRKYQPNRFTCLWFTAFQWGVIFMHNQSLPLFDGEQVKLFIVQSGS